MIKNHKQRKEANVEKAREIGKKLALKRTLPPIPHTMLHGWEMDTDYSVDDFKRIDFQWLEFCDALYFIDESPGAMLRKRLQLKEDCQILRL